MTSNRTPGERIARIIDQACLMWSVDRDELLGRSRVMTLTPPRAAIALALRAFAPKPLSYPRIAQIMLRDDHATIMNLADRARDLRRQSTGYRRAVDALCAVARNESPW